MKENTKSGVRATRLPTDYHSSEHKEKACKLCGAVINKIYDNEWQGYKFVCQNCSYTRYEIKPETYLPASFSKATDFK